MPKDQGKLSNDGRLRKKETLAFSFQRWWGKTGADANKELLKESRLRQYPTVMRLGE